MAPVLATKSDSVKPSRLIAHFTGSSVHDQGSGWCTLWEKGESDLWDRGKPSPALVDLVEQRRDILPSRHPDGRRRKALVPGCGRGYDVVMLALHGFDAYGLEISADAVAAAEAYSASEVGTPSAYNFSSANRESLGTPGRVTFIQGDFFNPLEGDMKFDLIYDYTFLCALLPESRRAWATRMADLLVPDGLLVCLEFPLYKDPKLTGPPWGLRGVYWDLLARGGSVILENDQLEEDDGTNEGKFSRVLYIKPDVSYEIGNGTDMLSLWHKKPS